jgi:hypothetical protein
VFKPEATQDPGLERPSLLGETMSINTSGRLTKSLATTRKNKSINLIQSFNPMDSRIHTRSHKTNHHKKDVNQKLFDYVQALKRVDKKLELGQLESEEESSYFHDPLFGTQHNYLKFKNSLTEMKTRKNQKNIDLAGEFEIMDEKSPNTSP